MHIQYIMFQASNIHTPSKRVSTLEMLSVRADIWRVAPRIYNCDVQLNKRTKNQMPFFC